MDSMTMAKARVISEKLHQLILMQVLRDEDLEDIGRIFVRAIERIEKKHGRKRNLMSLTMRTANRLSAL